MIHGQTVADGNGGKFKGRAPGGTYAGFDGLGDAVEVTEPTEKIGIHIDASESVEERAVIVEMAEVAETPVWTKIVEAKPKKVAAKAGGATKAGAAKVAKKTNVGKKM